MNQQSQLFLSSSNAIERLKRDFIESQPFRAIVSYRLAQHDEQIIFSSIDTVEDVEKLQDNKQLIDILEKYLVEVLFIGNPQKGRLSVDMKKQYIVISFN